LPQRRQLKLTDPRALRAVAHPVRLALLGLLRREGPLTATQAAARVRESPAACSFHLRPWRATAMFTSWPAAPETPELAAATELLTTVIAERYLEHLLRWIDSRGDEPREWQERELFGDVAVYLTPDELGELDRAIQALVAPYLERTTNPELRPDASRLVMLIALGFPLPEDVT
jgi:hypothetical protein